MHFKQIKRLVARNRSFSGNREHSRGLMLESLESRVVMTAGTAAAGGSAMIEHHDAEGEAGMIMARLSMFVDSDEVAIPANIGIDANDNREIVFTDMAGGTLLANDNSDATLGDFFEVWRTDAGLAGNNPNAILSDSQLLANMADGANTVQMFVNGELSNEFGTYELENGDEIILVYGDNPVVSVNTNFGPIVIELFEDQAPGTVDNFLNYVNDGDYLNSIFHRSADSMSGEDFVIQGGGFTTSQTTFTDTNQFTAVPTDPPIQNEPGLSNLRGTVAMAKTSDPDSATSQFFVNLNDDNTFLDDPNNSGGFTVFGQVLDLTTSDEIAALNVDSSNASPFGELPLGPNDELVVVNEIEGQGDLTGTKFADANGNGIQDAGEAGIAGATVYLDANNNGQLDAGEQSTTTTTNGQFLIQAAPGSHTLRTVTATGESLTLPASPGSYTVDVEIGREVEDLDFGETVTPTTDPGNNRLSGFVHLDPNGDGSRDNGEVGVPGVQITLTGADLAGNSISRTVLTSDTGSYAFDDLPSGTYQLRQRQPTATADGAESTPITGAVTTQNDVISNIVLTGDQNFAENNFGESRILNSFVSIRWFFASAQPSADIFRETMAIAEEQAGNTVLAAAIRAGGSDVPVDPSTPPVAVNDAYSTDEDVTLDVTAANGVLANDTDADGDTLSASLVSGTANGTLTLNSDGSFTYIPDAGFAGSDSFSYQASDGENASTVATVNLTVNAVTPAANTFALDENANAGTLIGTLMPEAEFGPGTVFELADPTLDSELELAADDHISGNPAGSVVLIEYLDFQCPVCRTFHPIVEQLESDFADELVVISRHFPLEQAHPNAFAAAVAAEAAGRQGAFDAYGDRLFELQDEWDDASDPQPFFESYATALGLDLAQFRADQDDPDLADRVERDADAVEALGATGTPTFFLNGEQIANPSSESAFASLIQAEVDATTDVFRINRETGEIFVRDETALDFETTPSFTLMVNVKDLDGDEGMLTATINLVDVNESTPVAAADNYSVNENSTLTVNAATGVLANDTDADSDTLTAQFVTGPSDGSLTLNADGSFTYVPDTNFNGSDSFTYTANDGQFTSSTATVTLNVAGINSAPMAVSDGYTVDEDGSLSVNAAEGVLANDTDPEGDTLTATLISPPSNGAFALDADGSFTYTPAADFSGSVSFTYSVSDGSLSTTGSVTIAVTASADAPVASGDSFTVDVDGTLTVDAATGVLANDVDVDGDTLTATVVTQPTNGTLTLSSDGSFVYTPDTAFLGTDTFTYRASDGSNDSNTATVTINVQAPLLSGFRLETTTADGTPITSIASGESFILNVYAQDLRNSPQGVFASYADLFYESSIVSLDGMLEFSDDFLNGRSGDASTAGVIDELGAFSSGITPTNESETLLVSIPFAADTAGQATFAMDPADLVPLHEVGLFGHDGAIPVTQVSFGSVQLQVTAAGGEGEGGTFAHGVDAVMANMDDWMEG